MRGKHKIGRPDMLHIFFLDFQPEPPGHQPGGAPNEQHQKRILLYGLLIHVKRFPVFLFIMKHDYSFVMSLPCVPGTSYGIRGQGSAPSIFPFQYI